jgi:lysophospholipid acyltransferase (LPLAT)-like uncharacterized protein
MKIRHPALIHTVGWLGARLLRAWMRTIRFDYRALGMNLAPADMDAVPERVLAVFWHENLLLPASRYGRPDVRVLISQHADGQMIAEVCQRLGFGLVRGSTTRGGVEAVRQMLGSSSSQFHLALTPDGPRGPRRSVQPGVAYLAARTGRPIIAVGIGYDRPWRLGSWDRFAIPRPWSRAVCVSSRAIRLPCDADRDQLERSSLVVQQELDRVTSLAERWAASGTWPADAEQATQEGDAQDAAA